MIETILEFMAQNEILATIIVIASALLLFLVSCKAAVFFITSKTKTKKDDEIAEKVYKALDKNKEAVDAVHKVAKKIEEKKKG